MWAEDSTQHKGVNHVDLAHLSPTPKFGCSACCLEISMALNWSIGNRVPIRVLRNGTRPAKCNGKPCAIFDTNFGLTTNGQ